MVGIGVIGRGFGRAVHIPGFLQVQNAAVVGVASAQYERARQVAAEFSLPHCFATWQELIECPDVQAVSIATPPYLHEEIALAALVAGKSVLCEKPMAVNAAQASRMLEAARKAGVVHMVDFEFREIPAWRFFKEVVSSGELGAIRHVSIHWIMQSWADPAREWSWRADRAQGGGTLGALGAHTFDYVEWLLGPIRSLAAHLSARIAERPDPSGALRPVNSEDCCLLLLELHDGTPVSVAISAVASLGKGHCIELYGEHKVLILNSDNLADYGKGFAVWEGKRGLARLRKRRLPKELQAEADSADGRIAPFVRLAQRFTDAVEQKKKDACPSFEDGLRTRMLMDWALQANQERTWVNVPAPQAKQ